MATLTVHNVAQAGTTLTTESAGGSGDVFANNVGDVYLQVTNGSGGSINVTFTAQNTSFNDDQMGPVTLSNRIVAVGNGVTKLIGPFPPAVYNNSSQQVAVSYSGTSSVTVAAIRFRPHGA